MRIAVEYYPDEAVLRALGVPRRQLLHEARKGEVFNWLRNTPRGMGMADEDPTSTQPRDRCNYQQVEASEGLLLLTRCGSGGQRLIVVCPRLEDWLMQRAEACGVDPRRYHLPDTAKELHDTPRYELKDGFRRFLAELNGLDRGMKLLRRWVS
jgi:hypothetical protein